MIDGGHPEMSPEEVRRLREELKLLDRLHIGSGVGQCLSPSWLNVDMLDGGLIPYGKITKISSVGGMPSSFLRFDVTAGLPVDPESVSYIYASHFIEHIRFEEAISFACSARIWLKPGGIVRFTCPDLELWSRKYVEKDDAFFKKYKELFLERRDQVFTSSEVFMSQVHGWGHKWCYDLESLSHVLSLAGFVHVRRTEYMQSSIPDIREVEPDTEGRRMESLCVEATKP